MGAMERNELLLLGQDVGQALLQLHVFNYDE